MLFIDNKRALVPITKADLMYTRIAWRSDGIDHGNSDVIAKKSTRQKIKRRAELWENGEFTTLLVELRESDCNMITKKEKKKEVESSLKTRQKRCMRFVREGEFKKARQARANIPKWNGCVEEKLKPLYPERCEVLKEESTKHELPETDKWMWYRVIKNAKRATSPAASGKCMDHSVQCEAA